MKRKFKKPRYFGWIIALAIYSIVLIIMAVPTLTESRLEKQLNRFSEQVIGQGEYVTQTSEIISYKLARASNLGSYVEIIEISSVKEYQFKRLVSAAPGKVGKSNWIYDLSWQEANNARVILNMAEQEIKNKSKP